MDYGVRIKGGREERNMRVSRRRFVDSGSGYGMLRVGATMPVRHTWAGVRGVSEE